jgi:FMN reductase
MAHAPFILGIGGTTRAQSSSEKALATSLRAAQAAGARIEMITGPDLLLPMYAPGESDRGGSARRLIDAFRACDGLLIASPAYHGSISGLVKNALDYSEDLRTDARVYFDGVPIGLIACAGGWQAAGQTLTALRSIAHALRGWPTPLGAMLNTSSRLFDDEGNCLDLSAKFQLEAVGQQVIEFVRLRRAAGAAEGASLSESSLL